MNSKLVRQLIYPLHERLRGRRTFSAFHELEQSQWLSAEELNTLQTRKLSRLLRHAQGNCSYYRKLLCHHAPKTLAEQPRSTLRAMPLLDKSLIRSNFSQMLWQKAPGGLHESVTGGSTGQPLRFVFDRLRQAYDKAARMRTHRWFGVEVGDREIYLWGSPHEMRRQDRLRSWRDRLINERLLSAFNMTAERMDDYLQQVVRYQPVSLFGYPSSLYILAKHGQRSEKALRYDSLRTVFATGEQLDAQQAQVIKEYFGVPVANGYGSREAGFIGHDCPHGSMHVMDESIILEIVDGQGRPVSDGTSGEIVVTHLDAFAMPMIRYRTGDCGRRRPGPCSCGRGLGRMEIVGGRMTDHLVGADGRLMHGLSLIYLLREMNSIERFRIYQSRARDVDVSIVPRVDFGEEDRKRIVGALRDTMGDGPQVKVSLVDRIASAASGKHRQVVSDAAQEVMT